jgi:hypothetical protein
MAGRKAADAVAFAEESEQPKPKRLFPVLLLKGYAPRESYVVVRDGQRIEVTPPANAVRSVVDKVKAEFSPDGKTPLTLVELPIEEAREIIAKKIAERADGIGV